MQVTHKMLQFWTSLSWVFLAQIVGSYRLPVFTSIRIQFTSTKIRVPVPHQDRSSDLAFEYLAISQFEILL